MKLYGINVCGYSKIWGLTVELEDAQVEAMREDGIEVLEIVWTMDVPDELDEYYRKRMNKDE